MNILEFDVSRIPRLLQPIAWLVGVWHSDHGGKAIFPTIPKFTYGEHVEISLADEHISSLPALNYTFVLLFILPTTINFLLKNF